MALVFNPYIGIFHHMKIVYVLDEFPQNEFATSSISASGLTGDPGQVSVGSLISKLSWHHCHISLLIENYFGSIQQFHL